jgi:hypothetical protein
VTDTRLRGALCRKSLTRGRRRFAHEAGPPREGVILEWQLQSGADRTVEASMNYLRALAVLFGGVFSSSTWPAATVTFLKETCGDVSGVVASGEICRVRDVSQGTTTWVVRLGVGIWLDSDIAGLGAGGHAAYVAEIQIPTSDAATSEDAVHAAVSAYANAISGIAGPKFTSAPMCSAGRNDEGIKLIDAIVTSARVPPNMCVP